MSFFHQTSAGTARARRTKEREGHPRASSVSNSGRRHGTGSKNQDNRSPPSKSPVLQNSIYSQQNLMLNQIPGAPSTETSLSAPISPTSSIHQSNNNRGGVIHLFQQPYTPVALQQYLDEDQDDDDNDNDDDDGERQEGRSKDEKKVHRLSDAAIAGVDTDSTTPEKSQARRSLDQKESPKSTVTQPRNPLYSINSANTVERLDSTNRDGKHVSDMIRNMTPQKDHNTTTTQQPSRVDASSTGTPVNNAIQVGLEKADEHSSKPVPKSSSDTVSLASIDLQHRSLPQFTNGTNISPVDYENTELQAAMMRTVSHQSAPFATRTFTPPAPPLGSNRAPTQTSPIFVSPIPIRSRLTGDNYTTSYVPPPHYQSYQPPPNPVISENYPNHPMFQDYTEFSYPPPPTLYSSIHNAAQPALPEVQVAQQYLQGEQNDNPLMLISKLVSILPELQMFITQCQQSGSDGGHNLLSLRSSEQQNDDSVKCRTLEEKIEKDEQVHKEEILALNGQISDLQTRLRYLEADLADSKKSRDDLYEQLVMQRIETGSTIKMLLSEKDDLQKRCDNACIIAEKEAQEQLLAVRKEIDEEKNQVKELNVQIEQLRSTYEAQEREMNRASNQKHNELVESHQQIIQDFEAKLAKELVKSGTLARQLNELDQKLEHERRCLTEQFDHDKKMMTKTFEEKTASLRGEIRVENTRTSRSKEENAKLVKELGDVRKAAATDRARFQGLAQSLQDAACKIDEENTNLQKAMAACGVMAADLQNRNNG